MYKRRDQNLFPVAAAASKKFSDEREGGGEGGGGEEGETEKKKESLPRGGKDYAIEFHSPARRQMEDGENGARATGRGEAG